VTYKESIRAAVKNRCPYYYELMDVMSYRASSMPLSTIFSISALEILDADKNKPNGADDNKPTEVDTPRLKRTTEEVLTLKKKLRASPSSLSSDLTELSQLKREQLINEKQYKIMQFGIEERKLELLEQESTIKMEKLKA